MNWYDFLVRNVTDFVGTIVNAVLRFNKCSFGKFGCSHYRYDYEVNFVVLCFVFIIYEFIFLCTVNIGSFICHLIMCCHIISLKVLL